MRHGASITASGRGETSAKSSIDRTVLGAPPGQGLGSQKSRMRSLADAMLDTAPSGLKDASGGKDWDIACESLRRVAKDKRPEIRKECLTGLATLFRAHVSDNWEDSEEALNATCSNGLKRLGFVPSLLVQSYASSVNVGEVSERARLLLDDHMLDSKSDDDFRGCAFVSTVASSVIEDSVESSLGALFARTAVSQKSLQGCWMLSSRRERRKIKRGPVKS